jgi:hypothetical protein
LSVFCVVGLGVGGVFGCGAGTGGGSGCGVGTISSGVLVASAILVVEPRIEVTGVGAGGGVTTSGSGNVEGST